MRIGARYVVMRVLAVLVVATGTIACGGASLFRQYEYEEEMYLSLDGSATVYVNTSIAALNALRGTSFDAAPGARFDRDVYRQYFSSPNTRVTRISSSRRGGRRFVHVRLDVADVRKLGAAPPFAWSTYRLDRNGQQYRYVQTVDGVKPASAGGASRRPPGATGPGWTGNELVAFRLHLPSKIEFHNTGRHIGRGNILVWEQSLADRLRGTPLTLEARMQTQSILYRTLWLFGLTFVLVAVAFVALIWWVVRRGKTPQEHLAERAG